MFTVTENGVTKKTKAAHFELTNAPLEVAKEAAELLAAGVKPEDLGEALGGKQAAERAEAEAADDAKARHAEQIAEERYLRALLRAEGVNPETLNLQEMYDVACVIPKRLRGFEEWFDRRFPK